MNEFKVSTSQTSAGGEIIFLGVVCWSSSISTADRKKLNKLIQSTG